jgi:filamentous hemagglutinin family protein
MGAIALSTDTAFAQITPDNTLGAESSIVTNNQILGGAQRGINLFHSFQEFNVGAGQTVNFANPGVLNIFSRVTGVNRSDILGTLGVAGNANLFLINPNGIVFGPNARLDIRGSFVATTANGVQFPDGGIFSATSPNVPAPTLTVKPSAFFFNQATGAINNQATLQVPEGQSLFLLGGNVSLDGGTVRAPGGRLELGGLTATGAVTLTPEGTLQFPDGIARGDVSLSNGAIADVVAGNGGDIAITARNINISGSTTNVCAGIGAGSSCSSPTVATGSATSQAGNVLFNATGAVSISQSRVENNVNPGATGNAANIFDAVKNRNLFGSIIIQAGSLSLSDGAALSTTSFGNGSAGVVFVQANNGQVSVDNSSIFSQVTSSGNGDAGGILVESGTISLNNATVKTDNNSSRLGGGILLSARDRVRVENSQITSETINQPDDGFSVIQIDASQGSVAINQSTISTTNEGSIGVAGDITIGAREQVGITGNSEILSRGNSGRIFIGESQRYGSPSPNSVTIDNSLLSTTNFGDSGFAGDISISAREEVAIVNDGRVFSRGNFGRIFIGEAEIGASFSPNTVRIDNSTVNTDNSIEQPSGAINAGNLSVRANNSISLANNSEVTSSTSRSGDAGRILLQTNDGTIALDNARIFTTVERGGVGNSGVILVDTGSLSLRNGAQLQTLVRGPVEDDNRAGEGNAGLVLVTASGDVLLEGRNSVTGKPSAIFSSIAPEVNGTAGAILIAADRLLLFDGALVSVDNAGEREAPVVTSINDGEPDTGAILFLGRRVVLDRNSTIAARTLSVNGGDIFLGRVGEYVVLSRGSEISTTAGLASAGGNGGNIRVGTQFLVGTPRRNSDITAQAFAGTGGQIRVSALKLFDIERRPVNDASNDINASANRNAGGQDGIEEINSPNLDPTGITELPTDLVDPSSLIAQTCRPGERGLARGTFTNVGRGGVQATPGDALRNNAVLDGENSSVAATPTAKPSNQIIEAQGWVKDAEGNTVFTAFAPNATPHSPAFKTPGCP